MKKNIRLFYFSTNKFLPYGTESDSKYYKYLLITAKNQNINNSEILIMKDEISNEFAKNFKKVIYLFDENHESADVFKAKYKAEKAVKPNTHLAQDEKVNGLINKFASV